MAIGECSVFIMSKQEMIKIKNNFIDIYKEMANVGIKRHKKHQIRIAKYVNRYLKWAHVVQNDEKSSSSDEDAKSSNNSFSGEDPEQHDSQSEKSSFYSYDSETKQTAIEELNDEDLDYYYFYSRKKLDIGIHPDHDKTKKRPNLSHIRETN